MFLSAVWTLTAAIHCTESIGEQVMIHFSKSVPMKKLIYILDGEYFWGAM